MAVVVEKTTRFIQQDQQRLGVGISQILTQDQKIAALFQ